MKTMRDVDIAWAKVDEAVLNAYTAAVEALKEENLSGEDKEFLREILSLCEKLVEVIENGD